MIRELAENPNVHQPLSPGRKLLRDPAGRFVAYLAPGRSVHDATVQRVRVEGSGVDDLVRDVRRLLRRERRQGAEWELGESSTPSDLVERLLAAGLQRDEGEPVAVGMVLRGLPAWDVPSGVEARPVSGTAELTTARDIQRRAFGDPRLVDLALVAGDAEREGIDGTTFVAIIDGTIVASAYAAFTDWGLLLFGGATLEEYRGAGAYRALVAARAREAHARGTPVLVVHAGRMSRPILERLGFESVSRIDRLVDVLA